MPSLRRILNQALRPLDLTLCKASEFNVLKIKLQQSLETSAILYEEQQVLAKTIESLRAGTPETGSDDHVLVNDPAQYYNKANAAEYDEALYEGFPKQIVFMASTPRVGSSVTLAGLIGAKILPYATEFLNTAHMNDFYRRWGRVSNAEYLQRLFAIRTNFQGTFGVKTHFSDYERFRDILPAGSCKVILLERKDKIAQAVSYFFGIKTKQWSSLARGACKKEDCEYDYAQLSRCLQDIVGQTKSWCTLLSENAITPKFVTYDEVRDSYSATIAMLASWITGKEVVAEDIAPPTMQVMRNEINQQFQERFTQDLLDNNIDIAQYQTFYWPTWPANA